MKKLVVCAALLIWFPGCALTPDTTDLQYNSVTKLVPIPAASHVRVNVVVNDVRGVRPDQIGFKKNGYGMEMAPILTSRSVNDIVRDAISQELRKEGFDVYQGSVSVLVDVIKFANDFKIGFFSGDAESQVILGIQVRDQFGQIAYANSITGDNLTSGVFIAGGSNAKIALEGALSDAIRKLMSDSSFTKALLSTAGQSILLAPQPAS